jgi:hypothetical protein
MSFLARLPVQLQFGNTPISFWTANRQRPGAAVFPRKFVSNRTPHTLRHARSQRLRRPGCGLPAHPRKRSRARSSRECYATRPAQLVPGQATHASGGTGGSSDAILVPGRSAARRRRPCPLKLALHTPRTCPLAGTASRQLRCRSRKFLTSSRGPQSSVAP